MQALLDFAKERCAAMSISYKTLVEELQISEPQAFRIKAGTRVPAKKLPELAEVLGVPFEQIICLKYGIPYIEPDTPIGQVNPEMTFAEWRSLQE